MHAPLSLLVIDDDLPSLRLMETVLAGEGFSVRSYSTGTDGVDAFRASPTQVVLIDAGLADLDGCTACQSIRSIPGGAEAVIVMLSESLEPVDRIRCFHSGADDFLQKPIDLYELVLRIKAIRRRLGTGASSPNAELELQAPPYRLDPATRSVDGPTGTVGLTPIEYQLLAYLMQHPNTLVGSETLLQDVWRYHPGTGSPDIVRFHVRSLRQKIEPRSDEPRYLVSAQGHGYMLRSNIRETS